MAMLKSASAEAHRSAERTLFAQALMQRRLTPAAYAQQLIAMRELHAAIEEGVASTELGRRVFEAEMAKGPMLDADIAHLASLGWPVENTPRNLADATLNATNAMRAMGADEARLLGALYVLEGSTLGSAFLLPAVRASLGLDVDGTRYYAGYGSAARPRWAAFSARMDAALEGESATASAIEGARAAFAAVQSVFEAIGDTALRSNRSTRPPASARTTIGAGPSAK
jgi:heme oxygenase